MPNLFSVFHVWGAFPFEIGFACAKKKLCSSSWSNYKKRSQKVWGLPVGLRCWEDMGLTCVCMCVYAFFFFLLSCLAHCEYSVLGLGIFPLARLSPRSTLFLSLSFSDLGKRALGKWLHQWTKQFSRSCSCGGRRSFDWSSKFSYSNRFQRIEISITTH